MPYSIRAARPGDEHSLGPVHLQVWREAYAGVLPAPYLAELSVESFTERWHELLRSEADGTAPRRTFVLCADGEPVGIATAGPSRDDPADPAFELYAINVLAAHHGSGRSRALLEAAVDAVAPDAPLSLWVLRGNDRAMAFYRRLGFAPDGRTKPHPGTGVIEERWVR
ncbi:GNAT family N-acetyltransferase [Angustibacter sp. McL0619]|uniref:GNAT family N-acetyltransferase n=1 Tax=Angustibacter sp. McL0619 TaxID=3415676 RepID=UPI003CF19B07